MAEPAFNENGAFNINGQWATGLRYEVNLDGGSFADGTIKFINGRKQVASVKIESREEAVEILGERNVENIEAGKGKEKDAAPGTAKGKLQAENLAFKQSYTPDKKPVNEIEASNERDASLEKDVLAFVAKRREEMARSRQQRLQNERIVSTEERGDPGAKKADAKEAKTGTGQSVEDRAKAIPDAVKQRFIQVDNKFHFPDKTLAFEDRGRKLATRSENQEVVRSMVAITYARGWDRITVRGTEEFRRAAWLEASLTGIEVSGYKPTNVEKAHLATLLERQGGTRENSIEEREPREREVGITRPKQPPAAATTPAGSKRTLTPDADQEAAVKTPSGRPGIGVKLRDGVLAGKLLEHGEANYQHDPKKETSYFVKVETERGEHTVWGVDLGRAVAESGAAIGDRVAIEKVDSKPVTAKERVFDKDGKEVGERAVNTHRNRWQVGSLEKAEAFTRDDRAEVVKKHPDLAPTYGTVDAAQKFAEKQFANKEDQARFVAIARQVVAEKIAHGENVPAPKIREAKVQERPKDQGKDQERSEPPTPREANQEAAR